MCHVLRRSKEEKKKKPQNMPSLSLRSPVRRLLVVNRGEIAVRILQAAHELASTANPIETFALYTDSDITHCHLGRPEHAIRLPSPTSYMDISYLISLAREHQIDHIHPGYGFLSESAEFAKRMWTDAGVTVIGPRWQSLRQLGDKVLAKELARKCGVPTLEALKVELDGVNSSDANNDNETKLDMVRSFANRIGYPVMIKAVDGGGGRGIRLVTKEPELQNALDRATSESPSNTVFVEKAAVGGFHHVEVQIIGDGRGGVQHLWERDCSVQRRFQKIVECSPALIGDRILIRAVIDAAVKMAREVHYLSLGTFEFLVNERQQEFYFLEINPRIQVEHTITESITGADLVQSQLLLAQGYLLEDLALPSNDQANVTCQTSSIQLRIYAEDPSNNFSLSVGKITQFSIPGGNGIRVDTHIPPTGGPSVLIGPDFDSLLAKIIVTAKTWEGAVLKARRVLSETTISGVKTNLSILQGVLYHDDFLARRIDTQWLESNLNSLNESGQAISRHNNEKMLSLEQQLRYSSPRASEFGMVSSTAAAASPALATSSSNFFFRKGDAWDITLRPLTSGLSPQETTLSGPGDEGGTVGEGEESRHILRLNRLLRNQFPTLLSAEIEYTHLTTIPQPTQPTSSNVNKVLYHLTITSNTSGGIASTVQTALRKGSPSNSNHIVSPLSGKLIEMLVREGDVIVKDQVVAFVRQMKMELEVRSPRGGRVYWSLSLRQPQCREGHGDKHDEDEGGNKIDECEDAKSESQGMVSDQGVDITEGTLLVELSGGNSSINVIGIDANRAVKGKL